MRAPTNPFKKALKQGKTVFGCWLGLANPFSTELMGTAGFDWLVIDGEVICVGKVLTVDEIKQKIQEKA